MLLLYDYYCCFNWHQGVSLSVNIIVNLLSRKRELRSLARIASKSI